MATVKFIQAQKFSLSGSGSSIGDTSITLQSMLGIDGVALITADIGVKGFGTLEPGNGIQEEQVSFTGITQNANGTATLTGVKTVAFISPYTETSGLAKTHAGASTFILSNDAGFYGQILSYIDTALSSGAIPATTLVNGISTLSVAPASAAQPVVVGTNDPRLLASGTAIYTNSIVNTGIPYVVATGTATALTATLASSISTLASGTFINFLVPITNASGVTLNVNSLGAKTIKKSYGTALASGDITIGEVAQVVYDGTQFQLQTPSSAVPFPIVYATGATWVKPNGLKYVVVEVIGGGGGGGGSATAQRGSGGGGGGGYSKKVIPATTLGATETVTVGGGGAGSGTGTGTTGGTSSFGSHASATGGSGGVNLGGGGVGGVGSSGNMNATGTGGMATGANIASALSSGGAGGGSFIGGGGAGVGNSGGGDVGGTAGGLYGGGGSGSTGGSNLGGAGAAGSVFVTEYYL